MSPDSPERAVRPPHPLAFELIDRLRGRAGVTILEVGAGSGRNTRALRAAGFCVTSLDDDVKAAAAISTHALLHGTVESISAMLERVAARLEPEAPFFVTFGSTRDGRFGEGTRIAENVYAPDHGDERGIAHAFFDAAALQRLLEPCWRIESLREESVDDVAGRWAHEEQPLHGAFHWFAIISPHAGN